LADGEAKKRRRAGSNYPTDGDIHPLRVIGIAVLDVSERMNRSKAAA
jgi:hypothetical protein